MWASSEARPVSLPVCPIRGSLAHPAASMKQYPCAPSRRCQGYHGLLRSAFIALSQNKSMRSFSERSTIGRKLSGRFVAGMSVDDVLACCERVNREGIAATLDSLGESVTTETEAQKSAVSYHQ